MKYIIHQKSLIGFEERQDIFEKEVAKKIKPIERLLSALSGRESSPTLSSRYRSSYSRASVGNGTFLDTLEPFRFTS